MRSVNIKIPGFNRRTITNHDETPVKIGGLTGGRIEYVTIMWIDPCAFRINCDLGEGRTDNREKQT